jgi:uncharacterized protein YjiS (DUF1127 family)
MKNVSARASLALPAAALMRGPRLGLESGLLDVVACWHDRWVQRRELEELNDHQLADIGISRCDALREANKPFWRR